MNKQTPPPFLGLSSLQVAERREADQVNSVHEQTSRSLGSILRSNILTRFNAIVAIMTIVVVSIGSLVDSLFGGVAILNSAIGIFQELRAKRTLDALAILHAPTATVIRDGNYQDIPIKQIVLDDILKIKVGDQIPTDGTVLRSEGLEIDESLLTGESDPIYKKPAEQVRSGSIVVAGHGYFQTTAVGAETYVHGITQQVKRFSVARSELVEGTNKLLKYISWTILVVAPIIVWGQIVRSNTEWREAVVRSTAAIDGMIPQGLILLTSLTFMLATLALAKRKVLVQQLPAVEGLARVDVICLDKTGTLTEGKIAFEQLITLTNQPESKLHSILAAFATEATSPTLQAIQEAHQQHTAPAHTMTVPFSSARKWSALKTTSSEHWILGAPEMTLPDETDAVRRQANQIAQDGKRVLLLLESKHQPTTTDLPSDLVPVAIIILSEKIRSDAAEALRFFSEQGVQLKIISGDNPRTVAAIAKTVGVSEQEAFDARSLPTEMHELAELLETHSVFGRVNPDQKRAMIKALQSKGHVVAMTGDGVNDALALKDADIGIAMGNGAPATRSIAELVLLDNKFSHMPHVLAEGRRVIANIERVASFFIIKNVYSLALGLAVTVAAFQYPFLPRHITILSALTIGVPAFLLSLAPNNRRYVSGFLGRVLRFSVPVGAVIAVAIFASHAVIMNRGGSEAIASTMASIIVMVLGLWVLVCLARPLRFWKIALVVALGAAFAALLYVPFARGLAQFDIMATYAPIPILVSGLGIVLIEFIWRRTQSRQASASL